MTRVRQSIPRRNPIPANRAAANKNSESGDWIGFGSDNLKIAPVETPKEALETLSKYPFTQEEVDMILSNDASAWLFGN